jgi:hypothetical protein
MSVGGGEGEGGPGGESANARLLYSRRAAANENAMPRLVRKQERKQQGDLAGLGDCPASSGALQSQVQQLGSARHLLFPFLPLGLPDTHPAH